MKYLFFSLLTFSAMASTSTAVDKIRTMKIEKGTYTVTLWNNNSVLRVSDKSKVVPCLENADKAKMHVAVTIDSEKNTITDCKLFSGPHPGAQKSNQSQQL